MDRPGPFSEPQAAHMLGVSARTLSRWRLRGAIQHYSRTPGRRLFYSLEDIHRIRVSMRVSPGVD